MDYRDESEAGEPFLPDEVVKIRHEAEISYHGPNWIRFAVGVTLLFAVSAITFGVVKPKVVSDGKPPVPRITPPTNPTIETGNLPLTLSAHFMLSKDGQMPSHVSVSNHALYVSELTQPVNEWPTIEVSETSFADSGEPFSKAEQSVGKIELVPPISSPSANQSASTVSWTVKDWHFWVMGSWVVSAVDWTVSDAKTTETQLYALYAPTKKYGMFQTFTSNATKGRVQIGAGDGVVIVRSDPPGGSQNSKTTKAKPLQAGDTLRVETLGGSNPLDPVESTHNVVLINGANLPVVHGQSLIYRATQSGTLNTVWFKQSFNGQPTPIGTYAPDTSGDMAVVGNDGAVYDVQAVPSTVQGSGLVVRMSPVNGLSSSVNQSMALPSLVRFWHVTHGTLVWTEQVNKQWMLVVGTVS